MLLKSNTFQSMISCNKISYRQMNKNISTTKSNYCISGGKKKTKKEQGLQMWSNSKQWLSHRIGWLDSRRLILSTEPRPLYRSCTSHHDQSSTASQTLLLSSNADFTLIWLGLLSSEAHWNLNLDSTPTKPWPFLLRCSRILPVHIFYLIVVFCLTTHVSCAGLGVLWAAEAVWQWMEVVRGSHHSRGLWEWSH